MSLADLARDLFKSQEVVVNGRQGKVKGFKPLDMVDVEMRDGKTKSFFVGNVKPTSKK
jgi:hypothetical protein